MKFCWSSIGMKFVNIHQPLLLQAAWAISNATSGGSPQQVEGILSLRWDAEKNDAAKEDELRKGIEWYG